MRTRYSPNYCETTTNKSAHSRRPRMHYAMPIPKRLMLFGFTSARSIPPWIRLRAKKFTNQAVSRYRHRRTTNSASAESPLMQKARSGGAFFWCTPSDATTGVHFSELIYGINARTGCSYYPHVAESWPRQWQDRCSRAYRNRRKEHADRPRAGWDTPSHCRES